MSSDIANILQCTTNHGLNPTPNKKQQSKFSINPINKSNTTIF